MTKTFLIAATAFLAAAANAQKKNAPAASATENDSFFSSDTRLVLVDSIVTDKKGASIGDLTQKDFKVREDGKEQTITGFSYVADGAQDQKQYLVLMFDNSTMPQTDQHYARDAAIKFIGSNGGRNRFMAVVEFDGALRVTQNLTDDVELLKQAVTGAKFSAASAGAPVTGAGVLRALNNPASALPEAMRNLAKGLARVPGRKTVLLFSEGISGSANLMKGAVEESNRVNTAIYPVDIHALASNGTGRPGFGEASGGRASQPLFTMSAGANRQAAEGDLSAPSPPSDVLFGLAQGTGGFVVSSPDKLADDMNRVGKEESQYYILSYLPASTSQPGACHALKVAVDRGGSHVRARTSYCDTVTPEVVTGTPTERDLEARLNANATPTVPATMQTPYFYVAANTARVDLALDIPGAGIKFAKDKGKFAAVLNLIGIAYLPDNGVAARFNDTRKVTLDNQQQVDDFASRPYHFEKQFEMASGKFDLKVAFSSSAAGFGKVETPATIDPWDPSKFLLSGLALSQSTHPAAAAGFGDVDLFGDQVPLNANGVQFIPAGTNRLQKSQKSYIYGEIYEPALKDDPGLGTQLTLLNAKTGEIIGRSGVTGLKPGTIPGTSAVPFGITLPTDQLAPGSYTAELTVLDAAGNHSMRRIDFELMP
jgi:VWFA-related protein